MYDLVQTHCVPDGTSRVVHNGLANIKGVVYILTFTDSKFVQDLAKIIRIYIAISYKYRPYLSNHFHSA